MRRIVLLVAIGLVLCASRGIAQSNTAVEAEERVGRAPGVIREDTGSSPVSPTITQLDTIGTRNLFVDTPIFAQKCPATRIECESRPWIYPVSRIALYGGFAADLVTTIKLDGKTREENPILGQSPARQLVLSGSLTVGFDLATRYLHGHGHEKLAETMNFLAGGAHFGAAGWNMHVMGASR